MLLYAYGGKRGAGLLKNSSALNSGAQQERALALSKGAQGALVVKGTHMLSMFMCGACRKVKRDTTQVQEIKQDVRCRTKLDSEKAVEQSG